MVYTIVILLTAPLIWYFVQRYKNEWYNAQQLAARLINLNEELHETMALGLYHRFKAEEGKEETPIEFEHFVSRIVEDYYGGHTYLTQSSGDYGVDIEHEREDGLYLGQVKCYAPHNGVSFDPIAIIHSQMVKQNAKGGFVVTTSYFTDNAKKYAQGLNIELIEGKELVHQWAATVEAKRRPHPPFEPEYGV